MKFVLKLKPEKNLILVALLPYRATFEIQKTKHSAQLLLKGLPLFCHAIQNRQSEVSGNLAEYLSTCEAALDSPAAAATTSPLSIATAKRQPHGLFALIVTSALWSAYDVVLSLQAKEEDESVAGSEGRHG